MPDQNGKLTPQEINGIARGMVLNQSVQMIQQIYSQLIATPGTANNVINITPRFVGLIKGFWVQVTGSLVNANTAALALTDFNVANVLSQIVFTDLQNNIRIQTTGWHLNLINSLKARKVYAAANTNASQDCPIKYGSNWVVTSGTATIAKTVTGTFNMWYWVPLAYSDSDLRGSVYANVVNATMQLQLTLNPAPTTAGTDDTLAIYSGAADGVFSNVTVNVWQVYLDQLPQGPSGPILPMLDLSTIYELKNTAFAAMVAGQDFPMQWPNFRDFLSTIAVYYNGTNRTNGGDINYWAIQSANFTNILKVTPTLSALRTRNHLLTDIPLGAYYFGSREKPIATVQYGNMELVLNPITAGATAKAYVGYEDFAMVNTLVGAGSIGGS